MTRSSSRRTTPRDETTLSIQSAQRPPHREASAPGEPTRARERIMSVQRFFVSVGLVLLVAACMDSVAPRRAVQPTPHFVKWAPATQPQFTAVGAVSGGVLSNGGTRLLLRGGIHLAHYPP